MGHGAVARLAGHGDVGLRAPAVPAGDSSFPTVRGLGAGTRGWGAGAGAARGEAAIVVAYSSCVL